MSSVRPRFEVSELLKVFQATGNGMPLETLEIDQNIFFVRGKQRGRFPYSNSLVIKGRVLLDLGLGLDIVRKLADRVEFAALTHIHPDHCGGAWIFNEWGKRVLSPEGYETSVDALARRFVDASLREDWKRFAMNVVGLRDFEVEPYSDGDTILRNPEITAMRLPGHTEDHHIFIIDGRIVFGSDIDLTSFGPWYGNPESDIKKFMRSIEKVMELDAEIFVSGHEDPVFGRDEIVERLQIYLEIFEKRNELLLGLLDKPKTLEELVEISPFYRKKPYIKNILDFFEGQMIRKHLNLLIERGKVTEFNGEFQTV
ncbi:MAG: MBL fold metallo-hydrolase [Candidatus Freyrarchaeum guaymaensis]